MDIPAEAVLYKLDSEDDPPIRVLAWQADDGMHSVEVGADDQPLPDAQATIWSDPSQFTAIYKPV